MSLAEIIQIYIVGAIATAAFCTIMEHGLGASPHITMRWRATLAWPLFWAAFALAFYNDRGRS